MKITILTPVFPYPIRGMLQGVERFVENIALPLKMIGHEVKIVTTFRNGGKKNDNYKGIPILRLSDSQKFLGRIGSLFYLNYISFGFNLFRKKNVRFYQNSDIILVPMAIPFSEFFNLKKLLLISIFFHYDEIKSFRDYFTYSSLHYLQKKQFKRHKNIITISENSKNDIIKNYGINKENIKVIPIGIDHKKFSPENRSKEIRQKYGNNILLFSAIMIPRKRIPILLKAMSFVIKKIPDAHLILTGEGPLWSVCKQYAKSLKLQNHTSFLGFVDESTYLKYLASCDIFILPSEKEGFGQVMLEAMASGTPVICADKPPMSEIIESGGLTFKLNNSEDLSNKIIELLNDREKLEELKRNALNVAKKYVWEKIVENYIDVLKQVKNG